VHAAATNDELMLRSLVAAVCTPVRRPASQAARVERTRDEQERHNDPLQPLPSVISV
jgi:hypothetical protein